MTQNNASPANGGAMPERHLTSLEQAMAHLGAAITQSAPNDDQIIMGHVRAAHELVRDAFRAASQQAARAA